MYVIEEFVALFKSYLEHFYEEMGITRCLLGYFGWLLDNYCQVSYLKSYSLLITIVFLGVCWSLAQSQKSPPGLNDFFAWFVGCCRCFLGFFFFFEWLPGHCHQVSMKFFGVCGSQTG